LLDREVIGIRDNFFELGGHSLKATRLASQIRKEFDVKVELREVFMKPLLKDQAQLIEQAAKSYYMTIPVTQKESSYCLSSSQRRLWVLSQFAESNVAYNIPGVYVFEGELD